MEPNIEFRKDDENPSLNFGKMKLAEFYSSKLIGDDFNTFIKAVEKMVRTSDEYKAYIATAYLSYGIGSCAVLGNIKSEAADIELHHYPYTLYDITRIVCCKFIMDKIPLTSFSVAMEVLDIHMANKVSFVPLSVTAHQAAHAGKIFIPLNMTYGDLNGFNQEYYGYIPTDLKMSFNEILKKSNSNELNLDIFIVND